MAQSTRRYLKYFICALLLPWATYGQGAQELIPQYTGSVEFFVRGSGDFQDLVIFEDAANPLTIDLYNGRRSKTYRYNGLLDYRMFRQTGVVDGVPQYALVGRVSLPANTDEALILVIQNPLYGFEPNALEFLLFASDDRESSLPWGHITFWNLTGAVLDGVLGDQLFQVMDGWNPPRSTEAFADEKGTLIGLSIRFEGRNQVLLQTRRQFRLDQRVIFVVMPPKDPKSLSVDVFRITEINRGSYDSPEEASPLTP